MKINIFVADEFRSEANGKQMALGLYPDDVIMLNPKPQEVSQADLPEGIDRLSFLINISDVPEKKHIFKAQIIDPSGKPHGKEIALGEFETAKGTSRNFIIEARPFLLSGKGTYQLNFYVDDEVNAFPFSLIERDGES